jgi:hypothetical protein
MSGLLVPSACYTTLSEARTELERRRDLRSAVEEWWCRKGWGLPPLPDLPNIAVMARQVGTFRYEDAAFVMRAEIAGLTPVWLEYTGDLMSTQSNYKRSLLELLYCEGRGRNGGLKIRRKEKFSCAQRWMGRPLNEIREGDRLLLDLHHDHQDRVYPNAIRRDITGWLKQIGSAKDYYEAVCAMYIAHGVLFEDYHGGESGNVLDDFTARIFEPAWQATVGRFGVVPLIVKLPWGEGFRCYPMNEHWREHRIVLPEHLV